MKHNKLQYNFCSNLITNICYNFYLDWSLLPWPNISFFMAAFSAVFLIWMVSICNHWCRVIRVKHLPFETTSTNRIYGWKWCRRFGNHSPNNGIWLSDSDPMIRTPSILVKGFRKCSIKTLSLWKHIMLTKVSAQNAFTYSSTNLQLLILDWE